MATVYASLLKGVLVEESLEKRIKQSGLKKLKDARNESPESCFKRCKKQLNRSSALSIDPKVSNCRDIAIAQKLMLYYGTGPFSEQILEWVTPLSPILGWNYGNEDEYTGLSQDGDIIIPLQTGVATFLLSWQLPIKCILYLYMK